MFGEYEYTFSSKLESCLIVGFVITFFGTAIMAVKDSYDYDQHLKRMKSLVAETTKRTDIGVSLAHSETSVTVRVPNEKPGLEGRYTLCFDAKDASCEERHEMWGLKEDQGISLQPILPGQLPNPKMNRMTLTGGIAITNGLALELDDTPVPTIQQVTTGNKIYEEPDSLAPAIRRAVRQYLGADKATP